MNINRTAAHLIIATFVAIIASANLSLSWRYGTLASPPLYDDVVYLLDAAKRVAEGEASSIFLLVSSFLDNPPHAPLSTLTAVFGYRVLGFQEWAPYVASIWALGLFSAVVYKVVRHQSGTRLQAIAITGLLMLAPIIQVIVSEFRPDIASGVIFATALYLVVYTDFSEPGWKKYILLGLAAAFAITSKPSAFVVVVPILGLGVITSLACLGKQWTVGLNGVLKALLVALIPLVPYAVIWGPQTYNYIFQVFVTNKDIWSTPGSRLDHMFYHSFGRGGHEALGPLLYVGLGAIILDIVTSVRRGFTARTSAFYLVVLSLYIGMGFSAEKTVFQGSFFYLPFLLVVAVAFTRLVAALPWKSAPAALLAGLAAVFMPIGVSFQSPEPRPELRLIEDQIADQVAKISQRCAMQNPIFLALTPNPLAPETIALDLMLSRETNITPAQSFFARDFAALKIMANAADFVMFPNERGKLESTNLPGTAFTEMLHADLSSQNNWTIFKPDVKDPPELWFRSCAD